MKSTMQRHEMKKLRGWLYTFTALLIAAAPIAHAQTASTTTLTSSFNPASYLRSVTFTATVSGSNPSGTIAFKDGTTTLGTATLVNGSATYSTTTLTLGNHTIVAAYGGDASNAASSSSVLTQVVNNTLVLASPNPSAPGQSVTFTA